MSSSGIQFPTSNSAFRQESPPTPSGPGGLRNSPQRKSIDLRRGSSIGFSGVTTMDAGNRSGSKSMEMQDSSSNLYPTIAKRITEMDMDFQRVKLYDARKRRIFEEQCGLSGLSQSKYIISRMARVLEDYKFMKNDEEKYNAGFVDYSSKFSLQQLRKGSTALKSAGSLTQLHQISQQLKPVLEGPIEEVEWFTKDNARDHRTDKYNLIRSSPVYRRGQSFFMAVKLMNQGMQSVDLNSMPLYVTFNFGSEPSLGKSTRIALTVTSDREFCERDKSEWDIRLHHQDGNTLTIQVMVSPNAPVGVWSCEFNYNNNVYACPDDVYVLFNPYCSDDPVYLDNEQYRREYVLSEFGKVFNGTSQVQASYKWIYGQFNELVLPMTCMLLDRFTEAYGDVITYSQRGSPVWVTRALASMINSNVGFLMNDFESKNSARSDCWYTGSLGIFEKVLEGNFMPLKNSKKYFASALYVTCCRSLGIPCRSITAYRVPVDKNTWNVDLHWDDDASGSSAKKSDLYEAYACFNDVYMKRDDLVAPTSYQGWQLIDPSDNGYGPAPAEAVRRGEIGMSFDVHYFYGKLNSQMRHFYYGNFPERIVTDDIGRLILTKKCERDGDESDDYEEITHLYKKKEPTGFHEDRGQQQYQIQRGEFPRGNIKRQSSTRSVDKFGVGTLRPSADISLDWSYNTTGFGQNLMVSLILQNIATENRTLVVNYFARPLYNHGLLGPTMKQIKRQFILPNNQKEALTMEVLPQEYLSLLNDELMMRFFVSVYIKETDQFVAGDEDIILYKPKLNIQTRNNPGLDSQSETHLNFSMNNPLSSPLTDAWIFYEGSGGTLKPVYKKLWNINPGETLNVNEKIGYRKSGESHIVATFCSRQLQNVGSSKQLIVRE